MDKQTTQAFSSVISFHFEANDPPGVGTRTVFVQLPAHPDNNIGNGTGVPISHYKHRRVFQGSIYPALSPTSLPGGGGGELSVDKKRRSIEDTLLEITAMNISCRSPGPVFSCEAVSEIHFASGSLCPLLTAPR